MPDYRISVPKFSDDSPLSSVNDLREVRLILDASSWSKPMPISLDKMVDLLKIEVEENQVKVVQSVITHKYNNQESKPLIPPSPKARVEKTYMAVDENYLYVWIKSLNRWKRTELTSW